MRWPGAPDMTVRPAPVRAATLSRSATERISAQRDLIKAMARFDATTG